MRSKLEPVQIRYSRLTEGRDEVAKKEDNAQNKSLSQTGPAYRNDCRAHRTERRLRAWVNSTYLGQSRSGSTESGGGIAASAAHGRKRQFGRGIVTPPAARF